MAATVAELDIKIDAAVSKLAELETAVDDTLTRKDGDIASRDASIVTLNGQIQTLNALVAQLQAQIAAGGGSVDLQPQVDKLITLIADMTATIAVLQNA